MGFYDSSAVLPDALDGVRISVDDLAGLRDQGAGLGEQDERPIEEVLGVREACVVVLPDRIRGRLIGGEHRLRGLGCSLPEGDLEACLLERGDQSISYPARLMVRKPCGC